MKTKIIFAMLFGLLVGQKSFASGPICFSFTNVNCSPPSQICVAQNCICDPSCCPGGIPGCGGVAGTSCCMNIPTGASPTVCFNGTSDPSLNPNGCGEIDGPTTPSDGCSEYIVTITSGCSSEVSDTWDVEYIVGTGTWYTRFLSGAQKDHSPVLLLGVNSDNTLSVTYYCTTCNDDAGNTIGL